jgi:DNA (cytosine-5)-methyltransferase 1
VPRLLDLFCKAGGATRGYQRAGWHVTGVDIEPQPHYCGDEFIHANALEVLYDVADAAWPTGFDAIHASPPCQRFTAYRRRGAGVGDKYENWIDLVRLLANRSGLPYVIENVPGAPLLSPVRLCGSSFGLDVRRHRLFESNVALLAPPCDHSRQTPRFPPATNRRNLRRTVEVGVWRIPLEVQQRAMGIDWMTLTELSEAVPPAYTEHIGQQLLSFCASGIPSGVSRSSDQPRRTDP